MTAANNIVTVDVSPVATNIVDTGRSNPVAVHPKGRYVNGRFVPHGVTFAKGQSGNPGGRPGVVKEVKTMLKAATIPAAQLLIDTMMNTNAKIELRIDCAKVLLDRVLGKALQPMTAEITRPAINWEEINTEELKRLASYESNEDSNSETGEE